MDDEKLKLIESFHSMWDNFPERVRLIRKDRTVIAVNKEAAAKGMTAGGHCIDAPPKEAHMGCQANQALKERCGKCEFVNDGKRMRFWIPVEGSEDVFVHFNIAATDS